MSFSKGLEEVMHVAFFLNQTVKIVIAHEHGRLMTSWRVYEEVGACKLMQNLPETPVGKIQKLLPLSRPDGDIAQVNLQTRLI